MEKLKKTGSTSHAGFEHDLLTLPGSEVRRKGFPTQDVVILDPNTLTDEEEEPSNYSSDIASAVAAILESAAKEPDSILDPRQNTLRNVVAQSSKSKKKIIKTKSSVKSTKAKRSKSTIFSTKSKSRLSLLSNPQRSVKSKSNTTTNFDSFSDFGPDPRDIENDDDDGNRKGSGVDETEEADGGSPSHLAQCGYRPFPPAPLPRHPNMLDVTLYIGRISEYFRKLGYNTEGEPSIRVNTKLSLRHHIETARLLIRAGEQIKCLHALVLAIHFTNSTPIIERFTINFKSVINGKEYKHIVLGIYMYGAYGSLGISRDVRLQDKPAIFTRLADLLSNFCQSYIQCGHDLAEIRVGGIIPRDPHSLAPLPFRTGVLHLKKILNEQQFGNECDKIAKILRVQMGPVCLRQVRPPEMTLPTAVYGERRSVLSTTGPTTTLVDENARLISKLRAISTETSRFSSTRTPKPSSTKTAVSKKKLPKK